MARVTESDVRDIFETGIEDLTPFIDAANYMTDQLIGVYPDEYLIEIERWLAAHLATAMDRAPTSIKIGDSQESYNWNTEIGLGSSEYGKRLVVMDYNGGIQDLFGIKKRVLLETMLELPDDSS